LFRVFQERDVIRFDKFLFGKSHGFGKPDDIIPRTFQFHEEAYGSLIQTDGEIFVPEYRSMLLILKDGPES
jgi:hypothetical protein